MAELSKILRSVHGGIAFWCPGCDEAHIIKPSIWTWDGNVDAPTISPSVLVRSGHHVDGKHPCWCDYNREHPDDPAPFKCSVCHSFVRGGRIEFLGDCTHALAGQTVPLPPWPAAPSPESAPEPFGCEAFNGRDWCERRYRHDGAHQFPAAPSPGKDGGAP